MKYLYPLICSLILVGCSESATTQPPPANEPVQSNADANQAASNEPEAVTAVSEDLKAKEVETPPSPEPEAAKAVAPKPVPPKSAPKQPKTAKSTEPSDSLAAAVAEAPIDAASLYKKCATCHGVNAEKAALGKSQVIAGWSAAQISDALKGYQDGSYGRETKAVMQGQMRTLSSEEIKALSDYISHL